MQQSAVTLAELDSLLAALVAADARRYGPGRLDAAEAQIWQRGAAARRRSIAGAAEHLRHQIAAGYLLPGDLLPTAAVLAARYQLSVSSVHRATSRLRREGLLTWRQTGNRGRRCYVAGTAPRRALTA